jgi:hypothetical protein
VSIKRYVSANLVVGTRGRIVGTRGGMSSRNGDPSERLPQRTLTTLLLSIVVLVLSVSIAQAQPPRLVSYGIFASEGPGVAVDQENGDVFTAGLLNAEGNPTRIAQFDGEGNLISSFGAESRYGGAVVNPVNGDLYALEAINFSTFTPAIDTYDPTTGNLLSTFEVPSSGDIFLFTVVQIAVDSAGNVYVPVVPENEVLEYSPSGTLLSTFKGSGKGALKEPIGVAVDSSGDLWVADTGNNRIEELSSADLPIGEIKSQGITSVVLDGHGNTFALVDNSADACGSLPSPCVHLVEYDSTGSQLADVGAGDFGVQEAAGGNGYLSMLAVNASDDRVYVTDDLKNKVWVFGPPTPPKTVKELASEVNTTEAKLGALIKAGGIATSYRFEYGTTTEYGQATPFPEGSATGIQAHTVWASASGLAPGTTYHYRIVATNAVGTTVGADQTFTTETMAETRCPNEQLRGSFSAALSDCRAYELVTPPNSGSNEPDTESAGNTFSGPPVVIAAGGGVLGNFAARDGERLAYRSAEVMPGAATSGFDYLATRGAEGWSSEDVIPLQSYDGDRCNAPGPLGDEVNAYSAELTDAVVRVGAGQSWGKPHLTGGCGAQGTEVVQGEPLGVENLLLRDNATGTYRLIDAPPAGVIPNDAHFLSASADLNHVIFSENARLTENAPPGLEDLYEWDGGTLRLVTILPDGTPVAGSLPKDPGTVSSRSSVVSVEGDRVFFTADGNLYVRINGEETIQLDESRGGSGPGGSETFQAASSDGTQAFFTDDASAGLTGDTVGGSGANLYRFSDGQLTDLTPAQHAEVVRVSGISEDGEYVYFVADGVLTDSHANAAGETAKTGKPNMYLWHGGITTFIATLSDDDDALGGAVRVSTNGAFLAFSSKASLTGYDNVDTRSHANDSEIFLYSAASGSLACVSCNPSGEPPSAGFEGGDLGGATFAAVTGSPGQGTPHYLTNGGEVFFDTQEALLPRDTNNQVDVYEYENGQLSLISAGTSSTRSVLIDASESGNDVFFLSRQSLVPQDSGTEALVIYDARVNGGLLTPVSPPSCVTADACRAPVSPQPTIYGAPSSQTFSGAGNLVPTGEATPKKKAKPKKPRCKAGMVRRKHRCVESKTGSRARKSNHRGRR